MVGLSLSEPVIDPVASALAAEAEPEVKAEETDDADEQITNTRKQLQIEGQMALGHLVYASLDHASMTISHPDDTLDKAVKMAKSKTMDEWGHEVKKLTAKVKGWAEQNPLKVTLMVLGLGGTAFKAKTISYYMSSIAVGFCAWSRRQNLFIRFWGFVALMSIRLVVSTLVPPTSPGFSIIIQAATPDEEKWTAMPCFLVASTIAGAWPWLLDKLLQIFTEEDFHFTMAAKLFSDNYPLTCWTGPAMKEAFYYHVNGHGDEENGKLGASFAVIVGHVVPFMGAQTTIMQRYFLPHPADSIASQPFGMTEDLVSMAMAEAVSNPMLGSASLTALIVFFNLARGLVFSVQQGTEHHHEHTHSFINEDVVGKDVEDPAKKQSVESLPQSKKSETSAHRAAENAEEGEFSVRQDRRDYPALVGAAINILVGFMMAYMVSAGTSLNYKFFVVAFQMMIQLLIVPITLRHTFHLFRPSNAWAILPQTPPELPKLLGSSPSSDSPKNFPMPHQQ